VTDTDLFGIQESCWEAVSGSSPRLPPRAVPEVCRVAQSCTTGKMSRVLARTHSVSSLGPKNASMVGRLFLGVEGTGRHYLICWGSVASGVPQLGRGYSCPTENTAHTVSLRLSARLHMWVKLLWAEKAIQMFKMLQKVLDPQPFQIIGRRQPLNDEHL